MEEIVHQLEWLKPYKRWDKQLVNWCRTFAVHSMYEMHTTPSSHPTSQTPTPAPATSPAQVADAPALAFRATWRSDLMKLGDTLG